MRGNSVVDQHLIKLRSCGTQPPILSNNGAHVRPFRRRTPPQKKYSITEVSEISENFLRDIFAKHFLTKLESIGRQKYIELTFSSKGGLYCLEDNLSIWSPILIPVPISILMPACWSRRIAMIVCNVTIINFFYSYLMIWWKFSTRLTHLFSFYVQISGKI